MQFRYPTNQTPEEYVRTEAWKFLSVAGCLIHPDLNCRIARYGTYPRKVPEGAKIPRILCFSENVTFSLLPDCLSSQLPGTLADVELVVLMAETAARNSGCDESPETAISKLSSPDIVAAADELGVGLRLYEADIRWLKRRVAYIVAILSAVIDLFPETFCSCRPTLASFRTVLGPGAHSATGVGGIADT